MVVKLIKVFVKPGRMASYLAAQEIWNHESRKDAACLGSYCGRCEDEPDCVFMLFFWRSREALDRWMAPNTTASPRSPKRMSITSESKSAYSMPPYRPICRFQRQKREMFE